ncbi:MAG: hypothetical protein GX823_01395 [Clostridiales bacterium]|nr:hypothetical protein [Clostridiales bacterium]
MENKEHRGVNKNGVSVASDGSAVYDGSLAAPDTVAENFLVPPSVLVSATDLTGAYPTLRPKTEFPDYDNFTNLGMKS